MGQLKTQPFTDVESKNFHSWFRIHGIPQTPLRRLDKKRKSWSWTDEGNMVLEFVDKNLTGTVLVACLNSGEDVYEQYIADAACSVETDAIALAMFLKG